MRKPLPRWLSRIKRKLLPSIPSSISTRSFRLCPLPNELLTYIFEHLEDDDLYIICKLSRCFNELALRVFLARIHFAGHDLSSEFFDIWCWMLPFLRLSFFVPRMEALNCNFHCGSDPSAMIPHLQELKCLVSRLSRVNCLSLDFGQDLLAEVPFGQSQEYIPDATMTTRMRIIRDIVYTTAGATHSIVVITPGGDIFVCSRKAVLSWELEKGRYDRTRDRWEALKDTPRLLFSCSRGMVMKKYVALQRVPLRAHIRVSSGLYDDVQTISSMKTLIIRCIASPPGHSRGFTVLSINPQILASLFLSYLAQLSTEEWGMILHDLVELQWLVSLSIYDENIFAGDVCVFLSHNPNITYLSVDAWLPLSVPTFHPLLSYPTPGALYLASLSAHPHHIIDLLESGHTFPYLSEISVKFCWFVRAETTACFTLVDQTLRAIEKHQISIVTLRFELCFLLRHHLTAVHRWMDFDDGNERVEQRLHCIKNIRFACVHHIDMGLIPKWLGLFPEVQELGFEKCSWVGNRSICERNRFLRLIRWSCPLVELVQFGSDPPRTVASWLEDDELEEDDETD